MKRSWLVLFTAFSSTVFANCELYSWRFHTEAVYEFPKTNPVKIVQASMRDGGILFLSDLSDFFKTNSFINKKEKKSGTINKKSLENAELSNYKSVRGGLTFLKLKEEMDWLPSEPLAFINAKERSITTAGVKYYPDVKDEILSSDFIPPKLNSSLREVLSRKNFKIVENPIEYTQGKAIQVLSRKLGEKNWKLVQVLTRFELKAPAKIHLSEQGKPQEAKAMQAWIAFLTMDDSSYWYIGNSSGNACGNSLTSETRSLSKEGIADIGERLNPNYGYRFDGNSSELIYSLGDPNIVYYLKYNELMVVVVNEIYR